MSHRTEDILTYAKVCSYPMYSEMPAVLVKEIVSAGQKWKDFPRSFGKPGPCVLEPEGRVRVDESANPRASALTRR